MNNRISTFLDAVELFYMQNAYPPAAAIVSRSFFFDLKGSQEDDGRKSLDMRSCKVIMASAQEEDFRLVGVIQEHYFDIDVLCYFSKQHQEWLAEVTEFFFDGNYHGFQLQFSRLTDVMRTVGRSTAALDISEVTRVLQRYFENYIHSKEPLFTVKLNLFFASSEP